LHTGDLRAFVAFKVRTQTAAPIREKRGHYIDIMAQGVEIQEQGGGVNSGKEFAYSHCFRRGRMAEKWKIKNEKCRKCVFGRSPGVAVL
jgi:hypothetical protein